MLSTGNIIILSAAVLFGLLGWWRFSHRPYRRSHYDDRPLGISREGYERRLLRRRRLGRVSKVTVWGIAGALIGAVLVAFLKRWFPGL
jgi:multisubunit Na+/H+ antiporter MnhG subunit